MHLRNTDSSTNFVTYANAVRCLIGGSGLPQPRSIMLIGKSPDIPWSEIISRRLFPVSFAPPFSKRRGRRRRSCGPRRQSIVRSSAVEADTKLQTVKSPLTTTGEQLTSSTTSPLQQLLRVRRGQERPREKCRRLPTRPWTVKVEGKVPSRSPSTSTPAQAASA